MNVIAVAAQMQNGKSTVVDFISEKLNWKKVAFAKKVKEIYCDAFNVDVAFIEKWKVKKDECPPGFDMPVRQGLQFIGDGFRKIMPTIWMDKCFTLNEPPMIIEDGRYINELVKVQEMGGINILIWRPGWENDDPNGSEAEIRPVMEYFKNLKIGVATNLMVEFEGDTSILNLTPTSLLGKPRGTQQIDYFIRNEGTVEQLYAKLENDLIPYLNKRFGL
jgi:hypothetical protein